VSPTSENLATWPRNTPAHIKAVQGDDPRALRLLELGLTPGTPITVIRRGFGGDPIQIELRHASLSISRNDAALVVVSPA